MGDMDFFVDYIYRKHKDELTDRENPEDEKVTKERIELFLNKQRKAVESANFNITGKREPPKRGDHASNAYSQLDKVFVDNGRSMINEVINTKTQSELAEIAKANKDAEEAEKAEAEKPKLSARTIPKPMFSDLSALGQGASVQKSNKDLSNLADEYKSKGYDAEAQPHFSESGNLSMSVVVNKGNDGIAKISNKEDGSFQVTDLTARASEISGAMNKTQAEMKPATASFGTFSEAKKFLDETVKRNTDTLETQQKKPEQKKPDKITG
ncbi:MAG: hypothetical protein NTY68_01670 [Candidatus Micrarchaeota archaeon]|nr:hypothetical protein [Candidatus Micrarchaeota archaeon]